MRRLMLGCLVFGGCLVKGNPAWEDSGAEAGAGSTSTSGGVISASGETPTTSGGEDSGGATGSQGEPTTAVGATTTASGESTGTGATDTGGSTGQPAMQCKSSERLVVKLDAEALEDAGVVPSSMGSPCAAWGDGKAPDCGALNFGTTGFYRLVNDTEKGKNAALLRFGGEKVAEFLKTAGVDKADLLAARLQLVVYEPLTEPAQDSTLEIGMLLGDDATWDVGMKDAKPATEHESSGLCRTIDGGNCVAWSQGDALSGSTSVGILLVTKAAVMMNELDDLQDQYHAHLVSEPLAKEVALAFAEGLGPSLVVSLSTTRGLAEGVIGIKLADAKEWPDAALYFDVCIEWSS